MPVYNRGTKKKNTRGEQKKRMTYICSDGSKDVRPAGREREERPRGKQRYFILADFGFFCNFH
jgi:hypothetical protein